MPGRRRLTDEQRLANRKASERRHAQAYKAPMPGLVDQLRAIGEGATDLLSSGMTCLRAEGSNLGEGAHWRRIPFTID